MRLYWWMGHLCWVRHIFVVLTATTALDLPNTLSASSPIAYWSPLPALTQASSLYIHIHVHCYAVVQVGRITGIARPSVRPSVPYVRARNSKTKRRERQNWCERFPRVSYTVVLWRVARIPRWFVRIKHDQSARLTQPSTLRGMVNWVSAFGLSSNKWRWWM